MCTFIRIGRFVSKTIIMIPKGRIFEMRRINNIDWMTSLMKSRAHCDLYILDLFSFFFFLYFTNNVKAFPVLIGTGTRSSYVLLCYWQIGERKLLFCVRLIGTIGLHASLVTLLEILIQKNRKRIPLASTRFSWKQSILLFKK